MSRFVAIDRDTAYLLPPSGDEWLPDDHLARKQTVEPVFGIIKQVMGWRQMSMRGLDKAEGERTLVTLAWNVKRLHVLRAA